MKKESNNGLFIIILLVIVTVVVLFFPKIYGYIISFSMPEVEKIEEYEKNEDNKQITEELLESLHYPMMRNSSYDINTYYKLDVFTTKNLSNKDILLNAFLDLYEGNITPYSGWVSCTLEPKQFDDEYLELRIKNIIGNKLNYILESFYVPEDLNTKYPGNWTYDNINSRYIYNGLCTYNKSNVKYYDLEEFIKAEYQKDDVIVYYYVGFAKVEGTNYTIYKDADYSEVLSSGTFTNLEDLNIVFKNVKNNKKIYKYTFKDTLCSYNEYCLYEGRWVNEL